ncbi:unnamed protein product [Umbelopsis vinacea]
MSIESGGQSGYWSIPTINQLKSFNAEDLSNVADFRAGRHQVGSIRFTQLVNLSQIDLDSILGGLILFEMEAALFIQAEHTGNYRALQFQARALALPLSKLVQKLQSVKYTRFMDYNTVLGRWRFSVQHFTRYEFPAIEDEDETMLDVVENTVEKIIESPSIIAATATAAIAILDHLDNETTENEKLDECHDINMIGEPDLAAKTTSTKRTLKDMSEPLTNGQKDSPMNDANEESQEFQVRSSFDTEASIEPQPRANKYFRVGYSDSVAYKYSNMLVDAGLTMGRSFRSGWGTGDILANSGRIVGLRGLSEFKSRSSLEAMSANVSIQNVHNTSPTSFDATPCKELLENMAEQTQITTGKSGVPSAKLAPGATFGHLLGGRWTSIPSHELLVLKLCQGLFDPVDEQSTAVADVEAARKKRFTKWLEDAVTQEMERDLEQHAADGNLAATVFTYLTGHRIKEACNAAIENRDHRLSTLLPQVIMGSETFRNYIKAQLRLWKDYQYEGMISKDYRKVYELMSGNVGLTHGMNGAVGDSDRVLVSEGLDWKRTLGLYIWYHSSPDSSLEEGLNKYLDAITHRELALRVAEPTPWYLGPHSVSPRRDMLFKIIKMYAQRSTDINIALDPLGITSDPLDYRMTWCLSVMLSNALSISTGFDNVTASFASQLEAMGLWEWAIYVQLHLDNSDSRQIAIQNVLARHVDLKTTQEQESFLKERLCIPSTWIEEAKALRAAHSGDLHAQVDALIKAEKHADAHHLVVEKLAPEAVKSDDLSGIEEILKRIDSSKVLDWQQCGQLFLSYIMLTKQSSEQDGNMLSDTKEALLRDLGNLKVQNDSRRQRNIPLAECISQMAVRCALHPQR